MSEANSAVQLRVAAELLFNSGHSDEYQGDVVAIVAVTQHFECGWAQSFGLVDDDQFDVLAGAYTRTLSFLRLVKMFVDTEPSRV